MMCLVSVVSPWLHCSLTPAERQRDCVTVRIDAPVAWSVTVRTGAAVGVANTLCDWQAEGGVAI